MNKRWGFGLIIASCILYGLLLVVPLLNVSIGTKTITATVLVISGEVSFWVGGIIVGKEVVKKYRRQLNPMNWFGKKKDDPVQESKEG